MELPACVGCDECGVMYEGREYEPDLSFSETGQTIFAWDGEEWLCCRCSHLKRFRPQTKRTTRMTNRLVINAKPLMAFAEWAAQFKTPAVRTKGFQDAVGTRGRGDFVDTLTATAFWGWARENGIPATFALVGGRGDDGYDVLLHRKGGISVNVKGSYTNVTPCHLAVKESEMAKTAKVYVQALHPPNSSLVILVGWATVGTVRSYDACELPNTGGAQGRWIPEADLRGFPVLLDLSQ